MTYLFEQTDAARLHAAIVEAAVAWSEYQFEHDKMMAQWHATEAGEQKDRVYDQARSLDKMADGKLAEVRYLSNKLRDLQISARE